MAKTWRIAGPIVNVPAAQAASDVAQAGVVSSRIWFMCCGLNTVVDVTPDAGKHWWEAYLPDEVLNVSAGNSRQARLIAVVRPSATATATNGSGSTCPPKAGGGRTTRA